MMMLVIDTVPNVFRTAKSQEHRARSLSDRMERKEGEKKQHVWKLFIGRCADESCIALVDSVHKHDHLETLGHDFTYGITELFLNLLVKRSVPCYCGSIL